ncbi:MAG TPA: hypothetical protein VNL91_08395 [Thermoanaerobaculia bacterium]|nr:hypothetical protein [Thermoanaerobaculia bacterium]
MILAFLALVALSVSIAFLDWRKGFLLTILCGVLQDPVRKLTPGTPVVLSMTVVVVYAAVLFAALPAIRAGFRDFSARFWRLKSPAVVIAFLLLLSAMNGVVTFGIANWQAPLLSLFLYLVPVPAVLLGYVHLRQESDLLGLLRFYAVVTTAALTGTVLEYFRVDFPALGVVALSGDYIRHLPGIQIRVLSGFYRGPDIMGWHAAMLAITGIILSLRERTFTRALPWIGVAGWGFVNCMISGRRKAIYMVAVFVVVLVWRYAKRLRTAQILSLVLVGVVMVGIVREIASNERSSVYARGAAATRQELLQRIEGGTLETIRQYGFFGAGLGTATQGVYHVARGRDLGWQEGGLAKLTVELGVPGVIAVLAFGFALLRLLLAITRHPDLPETSQYIRAALFAIIAANAGNFAASAQAYSDPLLTLLTAFLLGTLLATATLDERAAAAEQPAARTGLSAATA